jgi:dolichol kinase
LREALSTESSTFSLRRELARKGIHLLSLSVPLAYSNDLLPYATIVIILTTVTLVLSGLDVMRLRFSSFERVFFKLFGDLIRRHEHQFLTGSTFLLLSFTFSLLVFPKYIAIAVMYYTVLGDGMASLVGKKWGKIVIGQRTLEGSVACLLTCIGVGMIIEGLSPGLVVLGAVVATFVEGFSNRIDDNLTVPIVTGLCMVAWNLVAILQ